MTQVIYAIKTVKKHKPNYLLAKSMGIICYVLKYIQKQLNVLSLILHTKEQLMRQRKYF